MDSLHSTGNNRQVFSSSSVTRQLAIDVNQARQQLDLLGYSPEEKVFLRWLPRKNDTGSGKNSTATLATLPKHQSPDRALYLVVNGQSQDGSKITHGRALMFESDDVTLTRDQHRLLWQKLGLEPTFQVETRHSVHTYLVFDEPIAVDDWKKLQIDCNEFLNTDRSINDAPRLMRLAGAWHTQIDKETGEVLDPSLCNLINVTGKRYSFQQLRDIIPATPPKSKKTKPKPINLSDQFVPTQTTRISDYVDEAKRRLGKRLYEAVGMNDDQRLGCQWHDSTTGNSAWVKEYPDGSGYHWHCPTCTDGEGINSFQFWLKGKTGSFDIPKGKAYVNLAKEFCTLAGIEIPDRQKRTKPKLHTPTADPPTDAFDIDPPIPFSDALSEIITNSLPINDAITQAITASKTASDPIQDLEDWITNHLSATRIKHVEKAIQVIGAINSEYGDKATKLQLTKLIQACSPLVGEKVLLSNLKDINSMFNSGEKTANPPLTDKQIALALVEEMFDLRFNLLSSKVENNGEEFKRIENTYLVSELVDKEIGKTLATDAVIVTAHKNEYHPVKDYLESIKDTPQLTSDQWDNLAKHLLGVDDTLSQIILKKALIAAVARIQTPGCYVRMIPVLQGDQNKGKSTFFRLLAGDEFFSDSLGKLDNPKEDYQLLHSYWIHEWGELDKLNKKSAGDIKAFITKTKDDYRAPYARSPETHQRQCVIFGSCNRQDFLKDSTGNTRFSVIACGEINLELTKQWRDAIWATALARFNAGESWELTQAEQALSEVNNQAYTEQDPWQEDIESYVSIREVVSVNEILEHLNVETSKKDSLNSKRVRDVLTTIGWKKDSRISTHQGKRTRVWRLPPTLHKIPASQGVVQGCAEVVQGCAGVVQGVVQSESLIQSTFQSLSTTCTTKKGEKKVSETPTLAETTTQSHLENQTEYSCDAEEFKKVFIEDSCAGCAVTPETLAVEGVQTAQLGCAGVVQQGCAGDTDPTGSNTGETLSTSAFKVGDTVLYYGERRIIKEFLGDTLVTLQGNTDDHLASTLEITPVEPDDKPH